MPEASGRPPAKDTFEGQTWGELEDEILDQDGSVETASDTDLARVRRWMAESIRKVGARIGVNAAHQRDTTLALVSGTSRYALDYDVAAVISALDSSGQQVAVMDDTEAHELMTRGAGTWPGPSPALIWEELDQSGRMVVRIEPQPTSADTLTIWYEPKALKYQDREVMIPLPACFHPAVEEAMLMKLYRRQEDAKMLELHSGLYEKELSDAHAHYKPLRGVDEVFRSTYADKPGWPRARGRLSRGN